MLSTVITALGAVGVFVAGGRITLTMPIARTCLNLTTEEADLIGAELTRAALNARRAARAASAETDLWAGR